MEDTHDTKNYNSYYYVSALTCGALSAWIFYNSISSIIIGGVLGLLAAAFWLNVIEHPNEEA